MFFCLFEKPTKPEYEGQSKFQVQRLGLVHSMIPMVPSGCSLLESVGIDEDLID